MELGTYLVVWFSEGNAKCFDDARNMAQINSAMSNDLEEVSLHVCDGSVITVRSSYVTGWYRCTPETREASRKWERAFNDEEKLSSPSWEN